MAPYTRSSYGGRGQRRGMRHQCDIPPIPAPIQVPEEEIPDIFATVRALLYELSIRDKIVTAKLEMLLESQAQLQQQMARMNVARSQLEIHSAAARQLKEEILSPAASTADRISGGVKGLDNEKDAVNHTLEVVEQVVDLKACVLGFHSAIETSRDWELAATYLQKALAIPAEVIDGEFAQEMVPTAEVPDPPRTTIDNASSNLCKLFLHEFDQAAKQGDGNNVTRYFKLFPMIGKSDIGLDAYGKYVCSGVSARARENLEVPKDKKSEPLFYASLLTRLFEHIAQIVDAHELLVDRHYGPGKMRKVIEKLQMEADVQGGVILDSWADQAQLSRKMTDVKSYPFTFLMQTHIPSVKNQRSSSPVTKDGKVQTQSQDDGMNMKEVDAFLTEIGAMLSKWSLYQRFIALKLGPQKAFNENIKNPVLPTLISQSNLIKKVKDVLVDPFNTMTQYLFRRSVERAFEIDDMPTGLHLNMSKPLGSSAPFITSAVDDVMFIASKVLQRAVITTIRPSTDNVINSVTRILSNDFFGMILRKMNEESLLKNPNNGALPPESAIVSFLVLMNNLDVSADYVLRLVAAHVPRLPSTEPDNEPTTGPPSLMDLFPFGLDGQIITKLIMNMYSTYEMTIAPLLTEAVDTLLAQVFRPRLRTLLIDTFKNIDFATTASTSDQDSLMDTSNQTTLAQRFEKGWISLIQPIKRIATERNFDRLLTVVIQHLSKLIEKRLASLHGKITPLGAIKLEKEMTELINVATKGGKYVLRDGFTRTIQMLMILNMDQEEWDALVATTEEQQKNKKKNAKKTRARRNLEDMEDMEVEPDVDNEGQTSQETGDIKWVLDKGERERARALLLQ